MADATARKRRASGTWGTGSYPAVGRYFLPVIARLVDAVDVGPDDRALDVACGHGNVALTAHRRGAAVVGVDLAPAMLDRARTNAAALGGIDVAWHVGDAEALPFADGSFDVVLSNLGHMVAPDPAAAGRELTRVARAGGRIGFTAWQPDGPLPSIARAIAEHRPPEPNPPPAPARWSEPTVVRERLGEAVEGLAFESGSITIPAVSPADYWSFLLESSGPLQATVDRLDESARATARRAVLDAVGTHFDPTSNTVRMGYRLVTADVR